MQTEAAAQICMFSATHCYRLWHRFCIISLPVISPHILCVVLLSSVRPVNKKSFLQHVEDLCANDNAKFQEEFAVSVCEQPEPECYIYKTKFESFGNCLETNKMEEGKSPIVEKVH